MTPEEVKTKLQSMVGEPYEYRGCQKFLKKALAMINVDFSSVEDCPDVERILETIKKESHDFKKVEQARFGDVAIFWEPLRKEFHVGFMVDHRWMYQSSQATNGIGRLDISRPMFKFSLRGFYRHRSLCS